MFPFDLALRLFAAVFLRFADKKKVPAYFAKEISRRSINLSNN